MLIMPTTVIGSVYMHTFRATGLKFSPVEEEFGRNNNGYMERAEERRRTCAADDVVINPVLETDEVIALPEASHWPGSMYGSDIGPNPRKLPTTGAISLTRGDRQSGNGLRQVPDP